MYFVENYFCPSVLLLVVNGMIHKDPNAISSGPDESFFKGILFTLR